MFSVALFSIKLPTSHPMEMLFRVSAYYFPFLFEIIVSRSNGENEETIYKGGMFQQNLGITQCLTATENKRTEGRRERIVSSFLLFLIMKIKSIF